MKLEEVKGFLDYVKRKGILADNTVGTWTGAINAVSNVLEDSEKTIDYVLKNPDIIKNRLQNQSKDASGSTIATYIKRSSLALNHFIEWHKDRGEWEKKQATKPKNDVSKTKSIKLKGKTSNINSSTLTELVEVDNSFRHIPIPCSTGGNFNVTLPATYTMNDLVRVMWALAVYAEDFDPADVLDRYGKPPIYQQTANAEIVTLLS